MSEIKMNDPDLREIASALRYLAGREDECSSNRRKWGEIAAAIEEQVKPAIEEPTEFGSIVRAVCLGGTDPQLWQRSYGDGKHYWESENGVVDVWSDLTDVEVLRVGMGELPSDSQQAAQNKAYDLGYEDGRKSMEEAAYFDRVQAEADIEITPSAGQLAGAIDEITRDAIDKTIKEPSRCAMYAAEAHYSVVRLLDVEVGRLRLEGKRDMNALIYGRLQSLLREAITSERKNAYEKAIQAVEELAP